MTKSRTPIVDKNGKSTHVHKNTAGKETANNRVIGLAAPIAQRMENEAQIEESQDRIHEQLSELTGIGVEVFDKYVQDIKDAAEKTGYQEGYDSGKTDGYLDGRQDGYREAESERY